MGRIRSALRAYALVSDDPADVVALTDRKVQHFEIGEIATVAVAMTRAPYDEFHIASAGHLPPIVAAQAGPASFADIDIGPPLGAGVRDQRWPRTTVALARGSVAVLYTDGLVERRGEHLDTGLERLRAAVVADEPSALCQAVMGAVVGRMAPADDIAMLAMRRTPS
jgi:serine phosphatase RsbU (regulator of sigma subunit)